MKKSQKQKVPHWDIPSRCIRLMGIVQTQDLVPTSGRVWRLLWPEHSKERIGAWGEDSSSYEGSGLETECRDISSRLHN